MRLAITSDLHYPLTSDDAIEELVDETRQCDPDLLVLAGDLGESLSAVESCLRFSHEIGFPVAVVPGNHDLFKSGGNSSQQLWKTRLPDAVRVAGCTWLEAEVISHEGIAVVGTIASYDYSAVDPSLQESRSPFAQNKGSFMLDANKREKVTHVITGHTHLAKVELVQTKDGRLIGNQVIPIRLHQPGWIGLKSPLVPEVSKHTAEWHSPMFPLDSSKFPLER